MNTKRCSNCKQDKPLTEYRKLQKSIDGLAYRCKECCKQYSKGRTTPKHPKMNCNLEQKKQLILDVMEEYECKRSVAIALITEETYLSAWYVGNNRTPLSMAAYRLACLVLLGAEYDPKHIA